jgi:hypothetical protein
LCAPVQAVQTAGDGFQEVSERQRGAGPGLVTQSLPPLGTSSWRSLERTPTLTLAGLANTIPSMHLRCSAPKYWGRTALPLWMLPTILTSTISKLPEISKAVAVRLGMASKTYIDLSRWRDKL